MNRDSMRRRRIRRAVRLLLCIFFACFAAAAVAAMTLVTLTTAQKEAPVPAGTAPAVVSFEEVLNTARAVPVAIPQVRTHTYGGPGMEVALILGGNCVTCLWLLYGVAALAWGAGALLQALHARAKTPAPAPLSPLAARWKPLGRLQAGDELACLVQGALLLGLPLLAVAWFGVVNGFFFGMVLRHTPAGWLRSMVLFLPHGIPETVGVLVSAAMPVLLFLSLKDRRFALRAGGRPLAGAYVRSRLLRRAALLCLLLLTGAALVEVLGVWKLLSVFFGGIPGVRYGGGA